MEFSPTWFAVLTLAIGILGTALFAFTRARHRVQTSRTWWVGVRLSVFAAIRADVETLTVTLRLLSTAGVRVVGKSKVA